MFLRTIDLDREIANRCFHLRLFCSEAQLRVQVNEKVLSVMRGTLLHTQVQLRLRGKFAAGVNTEEQHLNILGEIRVFNRT